MGSEPGNHHPESIDPVWFQELIRRAYERDVRRHTKLGLDPDEAWERAMWYVFELRNNLTNLYEAGRTGKDEED